IRHEIQTCGLHMGQHLKISRCSGNWFVARVWPLSDGGWRGGGRGGGGGEGRGGREESATQAASLSPQSGKIERPAGLLKAAGFGISQAHFRRRCARGSAGSEGQRFRLAARLGCQR